MLKEILFYKMEGTSKPNEYGQFLASLQSWKLKVTRYEQKMGTIIDEDLKIAVLLANSPTAIRNQLQLEVDSRATTFVELLHKITNYVNLNMPNVARTPTKASPEGQDLGSQPMDCLLYTSPSPRDRG